MAHGYDGTKIPDWANVGKSDIPLQLGIYKGQVRKIDSSGTRSGRLWVYIDGFGSADANDDSSWRLVEYASPFMGTTQGPAATGSSLNKTNTFSFTKQSYGMFMTPPDIGNIVLCCFPGGDTQEGYWFACVNQNLSKGMIPSIGGVSLDRVDPVSVPQDLVGFLRPGGVYPVGEFNEADRRVFTTNWAQAALKPLHIPQFINLVRQGLDTDPNRGVTTSSVQRDPVSTVFGFSTPGRPTNDPAKDPDLSNKLASGEFDPENFVVSNRNGGHSVTLDDGDIYGKNNLVRLKSAAGHQILMHDTEGFIYIANSTGTAWVELTKEGDVLIYNSRDLSVRSQGNIMVHGDRNISFNSRGTFDIKAGAIRAEAQGIILNGEQAVQIASTSISVSAQNSVSLKGATASIGAIGSVSIQGFPVKINSGSPPLPSQNPQKLNTYQLQDTTFVQNAGWTAVAGVLNSINYKVPTHEPYIRGNIASVIQQQETIATETVANAGSTDVYGNPIYQNVASLTPGIDSAETSGLRPDLAAPTSAFIKQPDPLRGVGELTTDEYRAYLAQYSYNQTEQNYAYQAEDGIGKYNFSSTDLQKLGYLKPGETDISNPNVWTGKDGMFNAETFKVNAGLQEKSVYDLTKNNYAALQQQGLITDTSSPDRIAGLLSATKFGITAVTYWAKNNIDFTTNYGSDLTNYYNQGRYSQTQVPVIEASNNSSIIAGTA